MTSFETDVVLSIEASTHRPAKLALRESVGGGCINESQKFVLDDGRTYFVKSNRPQLLNMFEQEMTGLQALERVGCLRVPQPITSGLTQEGQFAFLVLQWIEPGRERPGSSEAFGRNLARLHQQATAPQFGFSADNYIGSTVQRNGWQQDWCEFWRQSRLGDQFRLARENGYADAEFNRLADQVMDATESIVGEPDEPPTLIHGDLWSGNYLYDTQGQAVLIDPAAYYGRREAELAMTRLFGGFDSHFYQAYHEVWPLAPGAAERIDFYQLYHVLNHLNLFGGSYRSQCLALLKRFA